MKETLLLEDVDRTFSQLGASVEAAGWGTSAVAEARTVLLCVLDSAAYAVARPSIQSKAEILLGWQYLEYWYFEGAPLSVQLALWVGLKCELLHPPSTGIDRIAKFQEFFPRQLAFEAAKRKSEIVGGWLFPFEAELFWECLEAVKSVSGNALEIGSWVGRSTILLAAGVETLSPSKHLHVVDDWCFGEQPDLYPYLTERRHLRAEFEENIQPWRDLVVVHESTFQAVARSLQGPETGFSFVFHDAGHLPADFERDLPLIESLMNPGAILLIHDYESEHFTESRATIDHWVLQNPDFSVQKTVGSTAVIRRRP